MCKRVNRKPKTEERVFLPSVRRRLADVNGYRVYEHRCLAYSANRERGKSVTLPYVDSEKAEEFNRLLSRVAAHFLQNAENELAAHEGAYRTALHLFLSSAPGNGGILQLTAKQVNITQKNRKKERVRRYFLDSDTFLFCRAKGLTKKQKNSIL